jgi:hypothetical protein
MSSILRLTGSPADSHKYGFSPPNQKRIRASSRFYSKLPGIFYGLPLKLILDWLPTRSIQNLSYVSKDMKYQVFNEEKVILSNQAREFINTIINSLKIESVQLKEKRPLNYETDATAVDSVVAHLMRVLETVDSSKTLSLRGLKKHQLEIKDKLISALDRLHHKQLNLFQGLFPSLFFEHSIQIAKISHRILNARSIGDWYDKRRVLSACAIMLVNLKAIDRAIPIAISARGHFNSSAIFRKIVMQLSDQKRFKKASEITSNIKSIQQRELALRYIFMKRKLNRKKAVGSTGITQTFSDDKINLIIHAMSVAKEYTVLPKPLSTLRKDSSGEVILKAVDQLLARVGLIQSTVGRDFTLYAASLTLSSLNRINQALSVAIQIQVEEISDLAYKAIYSALAKLRTD